MMLEAATWERQGRRMRTLSLLAATAILVALVPAPAPAADDVQVPVAIAAEASAETDVPAASEPACARAPRPRGHLARFWDWLSYQPVQRPCHACKGKPMPCCPPPLYTYFPCVNHNGQCPMGGYGCKTCGVQP